MKLSLEARDTYTHTRFIFSLVLITHLKISTGLKNNLFLKKDYILNTRLAFVYILLLRVFFHSGMFLVFLLQKPLL